jgi:hypothetical protein
MWDRCTLTVPGEMNRRRAMASLRRPLATRWTTSSSVGVRLAHPVGGRLRPPPLRATWATASSRVSSWPCSHAWAKASAPRVCRAWRAAARRSAMNPGVRYPSRGRPRLRHLAWQPRLDGTHAAGTVITGRSTIRATCDSEFAPSADSARRGVGLPSSVVPLRSGESALEASSRGTAARQHLGPVSRFSRRPPC